VSNPSNSIPALTRRAFLQRVATLGAITVLPTAATVAALAPRVSSQKAPHAHALRIGLVVPELPHTPLLMQHLQEGFQLGLDSQQTTSLAGANIELTTRQYGSPGAAHQQLRELIQREQVDLLSGFVSRNHLRGLHADLEATGTPLIVSDIGANLISADQQHPLITRNTLGYWQSALALGDWAAQNLGKRAVIAASFYESGYDTLHAFQAGFESAGGQILATIVSDSPMRSNHNPAAAIAEISQLQPDLIFAAYSGDAAVQFIRAYGASPLVGTVPLIGSDMLVRDAALAEPAAVGIRSAAPWAANVLNSQQQAFLAAYRLRTGRAADPLALLGYETAQLIAAAYQQAGHAAGIGAALPNSTIQSPRGLLAFEKEYLETTSPIYLREVVAGTGGQHQVLANLPAVSPQDGRVTRLRAQQRSGWINAYLSV
jgi:branched-chain amino acid transport system substrate-binding protein